MVDPPWFVRIRAFSGEIDETAAATTIMARAFLARCDATIVNYSHLADRVLRGGLGFGILLAGLHKLIAPAAWHTYLAPPFAALWPTGLLSLDVSFILFGVSEILFGGLLLADWHTPTIALLTALSLAGVVVNLVVAMAVGKPVVDIMIRDIGLMMFAAGVALGAGSPRGAD